MRFDIRWVIATLLCTLNGVAQQPAKGTPVAFADRPLNTGIVTGHVYLGDIKGAARKATVYLQPAGALESNAPHELNSGQTPGDITIAVETSFDGSFSFNHVRYGAYYVMASYTGYVSPYLALSLAEARSRYGTQQPLGPAKAKAKEIVLKSIPRVNVQSDQPATAEVTLERGGAISGNISYDDGSPAVGLEVAVLSRTLREGKETWDTLDSSPGTLFGRIATDDRGDYRISGLPDQKYMVQVTLDFSERITYVSSNGGGSSGTNSSNQLIFYSGNTPKLKDAVPFTVKLGEERNGEDIRIPMSKLHKVSGYIVSAHDGHIINSGQVTLFSADDKSMAGYASPTQNNPGFILNFVFDGDYTLTSPASMDVDYELRPQDPASISLPQYDAHPLQLYGSASIPLHVSSDMDGVTIAVPEPTAKEAKVFGDALQQELQTQPPH